MIELNGKHGTAKVFNDIVEEEAQKQIIDLLNHPVSENANVRILPDVHSGKGCVIGFTAKLTDKVVPNLIGVDIGCGVFCAKLGKIDINFKTLDSFIKQNIPMSFNIHNKSIISPNDLIWMRDYVNPIIKTLGLNQDKVYNSIGTLGGGNHFIELDIDNKDNVYLLIHTGSRNFGLQIAKYYQDIANKSRLINSEVKLKKIKEIKEKFKGKDIETEINRYLNIAKPVVTGLEYLEGEDLKEYVSDMKVAQLYAGFNRFYIANSILEYFNMSSFPSTVIETIHNYIDFKHGIIRKGAISAQEDETILIPLNMRDGVLICKGKGNSDWNYSAPHGAGRLYSRSTAKRTLSLDDFKASMKGIYSSTVNNSTLDESPMAYKDANEIIKYIEPTAELINHLKPIYNIKAEE